MNTFELNKIAGAVLGTVLLVMGLGMVADTLYAPHKPAVPGYKVEMAEEDGASHGAEAEEAAPEVSLASILSGGDAAAGAKQAKKCAACHTFDQGGANKVGPNLHGIVGRAMGATDGFGYSDALKAMASEGGVWSYENLFGFLANPKGFLTGTNMAFAGIKKEGQRADLVLYLKDQSPDAPDLPVDAPPEAAAAEAPADTAPMAAEAEKPMDAAPAAEAPAAPAAPMAETPAQPAAAMPAPEAPAAPAPAPAASEPAPMAEPAAMDAEKPMAEPTKPDAEIKSAPAPAN